MTRINVVEPDRLTDQHLFAELRELPRAWKYARPGRLDIPETYRMGDGHVLFFADKTGWLSERFALLLNEWRGRGFVWNGPDALIPVPGADGWWTPTDEARRANARRLIDRITTSSQVPRYRGEVVPRSFYAGLLVSEEAA